MLCAQSDKLSPFVHSFDVISLFAAEFEELKIGISGKGLKELHRMYYTTNFYFQRSVGGESKKGRGSELLELPFEKKTEILLVTFSAT